VNNGSFWVVEKPLQELGDTGHSTESAQEKVKSMHLLFGPLLKIVRSASTVVACSRD
jgi:hypothetical protein